MQQLLHTGLSKVMQCLAMCSAAMAHDTRGMHRCGRFLQLVASAQLYVSYQAWHCCVPVACNALVVVAWHAWHACIRARGEPELPADQMIL